jgi:hypothetical protein
MKHSLTVEEHGAILNDLARREHEEYVATIREWLERAEAEGRTAAARRHREHLARLDAMPKPWET